MGHVYGYGDNATKSDSYHDGGDDDDDDDNDNDDGGEISLQFGMQAITDVCSIGAAVPYTCGICLEKKLHDHSNHFDSYTPADHPSDDSSVED